MKPPKTFHESFYSKSTKREWQIVRLLTSEFVLMILIASVVSLPFAWYFANEWLNKFAYRSDLPIWLLVVVALATFFIAVLTTGVHTIKAARINPAANLKND